MRDAKADVAQLAERVLGKDEVTGSIPVIGSRLRSLRELRRDSLRVMVCRFVVRWREALTGGPPSRLRRFGETAYA